MGLGGGEAKHSDLKKKKRDTLNDCIQFDRFIKINCILSYYCFNAQGLYTVLLFYFLTIKVDM